LIFIKNPHQSIITSFDFPNQFTDEMIEGRFKNFKHQHFFYNTSYGTKMIDILEYNTPFGMLGKIFDKIVLKKHLLKFITHRNALIKYHLEVKSTKK